MRNIAIALRNRFGYHTTIWGVKQANKKQGVLEFELYWSIDGDSTAIQLPTEVAKTLRPWIDMTSSGCDISMLDSLVRSDAISMFSIDIDTSTLESGRVSKINVYLEYPKGAAYFRSRAYECSQDNRFELSNVYTGFEILHENTVDFHMKSSFHYPYNALQSYADCILKRPDLSSNLLSSMYPIRPLMICHASKSFPSRDGMYFSGIDVDQLHFFLSRGSHGACSSRIVSGISLVDKGDDFATRMHCDDSYEHNGNLDEEKDVRVCQNFSSIALNPELFTWNWPESVLNLIDSLRDRLRGIRFDVGFDYAVVQDSNHRRLSFLKSAFYGSF